jgi:hypothetical protein
VSTTIIKPVYFNKLPIYAKRGRVCQRRRCDRLPQWAESMFSSGYYGRQLCDEHAMERLRKLHGLTQVVITTPDKVVSGRAN